jgi:predicted acyltransferase (DUF342 family)
MLKRLVSCERGQVIVLVVGMVAIMAVLSSAAVLYARDQRIGSERKIKEVQAYYIADAGINKALKIIKDYAQANPGSPFSGANLSSLNLLNYGGGRIESVVLSGPDANGKWTITSTGVYPHLAASAPSDFYGRRTITATLGVENNGSIGGFPDKGIWVDLLDARKECQIFADIYCSGAVDGAKELSLGSAGIHRNIYANGNIDLCKDALIYGNIYSRGSIDLCKDFQTVSESGTIQALGTISIKKHTVTGIIRTLGNLSIAKDSVINEVFSNGTVTLADYAVVNSNVKSGGDLTIGSHGSVGGSVWTMGGLNLGSFSHIDGTAYAHNGHPYSQSDIEKVTGGINTLAYLDPLVLNIPVVPPAPDPDIAFYQAAGQAISEESIDLGTGVWNGTYYKDGDLTVTCTGGKYSGQITIVASGSISTSKDTGMSPNTSGDSLILVAGNSMSFAKNNQVTAFLWAGENIGFAKDFVLNGNIICHVLDISKSGIVNQVDDGFDSVGSETLILESWH